MNEKREEARLQRSGGRPKILENAINWPCFASNYLSLPLDLVFPFHLVNSLSFIFRLCFVLDSSYKIPWSPQKTPLREVEAHEMEEEEWTRK